METIPIVLLILWFSFAALAQLKLTAFEPLRPHDIFSLIPNWSFFAPRPGTSDYHLLFRDCDSSGNFGKWQEVALSDPRTLIGAIWNPQKRNKKALSDTVRAISILLTKTGSLKGIHFSIPYLATLNYISSIPRSGSATQTQFMILKSDGFLSSQDPELVFVSHVHLL
jgi:hypothetical protein